MLRAYALVLQLCSQRESRYGATCFVIIWAWARSRERPSLVKSSTLNSQVSNFSGRSWAVSSRFTNTISTACVLRRVCTVPHAAALMLVCYWVIGQSGQESSLAVGVQIDALR